LLNSTQKKVEALNFDTRKHLIDYDSVLSNQRELIYKQRDQILKNVDNSLIIRNMAKTVTKDLIQLFKSEKNELYVDADKLVQALNTKILNAALISPDFLREKTLDQAEIIITEILKISVAKRIEMLGLEQSKSMLRDLLIQNLDYQWTNHLDRMTKIREGVTLRSLEQRSPLNIYVDDADKNFSQMKKNVAHQCVMALHRIYIPKVNEELHNSLGEILPQLVIVATKGEQINNPIAAGAIDTPLEVKAEPKIISKDAKAELLEKMKQAQDSQNQTK
jgi:preprotein translocase subunit SecA